MSTHLRSTCRRGWFGCVLVVCMAATNAWSDTDKTVVDVERSRPGAASGYHGPRAAHLYHYDKTEVDLALPVVPQSPEAQRPSQHPGTLPAALPVPPNLSPRGPLPDGGR